MTDGILTLALLAPLAGAALLLAVPKGARRLLQSISLASAAIAFAAAVTAFVRYDRSAGGYQFVQKFDWIPQLGISYHVGVDGIAAVLLVLAGVCALAGVCVANRVTDRLKEFLVFYLLLIAGCFGVLSSLNIFFMYFFYECALIPIFPLIAVWGSGDKGYASMKLAVLLTVGAMLALFAILGLYWQTGLQTFDFVAIESALHANPLPAAFQTWAFPVLVLGFGLILTVWPLHTWTPIGYASAPSSVSMLHAGIVKKLGAFLIIRLAITLMPDGARLWMPWLAALAAANLVYCGLAAFAQKDMRQVLGYSSCSHLSLILLGLAALTPAGLNGAVLYMFAHGVLAALSFAVVGYLVDQTGKARLEDWGGIGRSVPFIATLFVMAALASASVPGFAPFVGEVLVLFGAWDRYPLPTIAAISGMVITAGYMLKMVRSVTQGPINAACADVRDARGLDKLPLLFLLAVLIAAGVFPNLLLAAVQSGTAAVLARYQ